MKFSGVWLPIITPFKDGEVDFNSYKKMIESYIDTGITGFIPLGTTGETPTLSEDEYFSIIEKTIEYVKGRVKVVVGVGGNNTKSLILFSISMYPLIKSVTPTRSLISSGTLKRNTNDPFSSNFCFASSTLTLRYLAYSR